MSVTEKRNVVHSTFCIERNYEASPERVFRAFADLESKSKWFGGPDPWVIGKREFDFRVGGRELLTGGPQGTMTASTGPANDADCAVEGSRFEARYFDIIPNQRIIYAYDMYVGGRKLSVSLATVEVTAQGKGTRLTVTEQGAYLDGVEDGSQREEGTRWLLDKLGKSL
jgi:uncharacterized protein YndB with AHSA1/START domain